MTESIEGKRLYYAYLSGAKHVMGQKEYLNQINVFPVPDGDTGTNLFSTMKAILYKANDNYNFKEAFDILAEAALSGARGNSGVIFAQYFVGISEGIMSQEEVSIDEFVSANQCALNCAYEALGEPVEGTILTVIRTFADSLKQERSKGKNFIDVIEYGYKEAVIALDHTKQQLDILKRAGVVDSGAKGFVLFLEGMLTFLKSRQDHFYVEEMVEEEVPDDLIKLAHDDHHVGDQPPTHRYCTEVLYKPANKDVDVKELLRPYGDAIVVAGNKSMARIHIHTNQPRDIIQLLENQGAIRYQKIDDMKEQVDIAYHRKHQVGIVVDSIADMSSNLLDTLQIHSIPLRINIEGSEFFDKLTINNQDVITAVSEGKKVGSSQPDIATIDNRLRYLLSYYDSLIIINVSSKLSGTYNNMMKVAEPLNKQKKRIHVIDSRQNSAAQGLLAYLAAAELEKGKSVEDVVSFVNQNRDHVKILVRIASLEPMVRSGRLTVKVANILEKVRFRPLISLDKKGEGTLAHMALTKRGSYKALVNEVLKHHKKYRIDAYSIVYVDKREEAEAIGKALTHMIGLEPTYICVSSAIIALSAGEGAIAVAFSTQETLPMSFMERLKERRQRS